MKIAILGWGSLLWEPGAEFEKWIELPWKNDGPKLKIEFSRISGSRKGALTLVIDEVNGTSSNVAWSLSKRDRLDDAISDLQSREGTTTANIAYVSVAEKPAELASLQNEIIAWATKKKIDAVIWTALKSNFESEKGRPFSVEEALTHLKGLDDSIGTKYLTEQCFLRQMAALLGMWDRTELQDAIVRALYWMADAYTDRNPMMQFVKLWSCIECFFAITKEKITDANAKGIASILVFGGYRALEPDQYGDTKRRVEALYDLRSQALHRAQFGHVDTSELNQLSSWVAWIIVTMVSLSQRGYKTLEQVKEQVLRLDNLSDRPSV